MANVPGRRTRLDMQGHMSILSNIKHHSIAGVEQFPPIVMSERDAYGRHAGIQHHGTVVCRRMLSAPCSSRLLLIQHR